MANVGYDDTPKLPGRDWLVHDGSRPQPRVVTPGADNSAPSDAVVLFDGTDLSAWKGRDGAAGWKVENGYMEVTPGSGDIQTTEHFADCQLHIEFRSPEVVKGDSQGRGNSGVFLMGEYEIQVLDSYDNPTYADGGAGSIYGQHPVLVNASRKPGEWQSYDIIFKAPQFDGDKLVSPAILTVLHNGVVVQHAQDSDGPTGHRSLSSYSSDHPAAGPLNLQDHGDLVRFRNIWMRPLPASDQT
jgi:hypothetical protein